MLDALKEKILGISETKKPEISAVSSILTDSFFDETIENPEAKIFKVLNQDLSKMIIKEEISMAKTSQKCKKMKECMVFLTEEAIFYESKSSKKLKSMDYGNGRIFFHTKEYEKTIFFGFFLLKEKNRYEFLTKDEENFTKVRKFLQSKLILMTFHVDYQVVKMIGKGSFAKVFLSISRSNGKEFAVKVFNKDQLLTQKFGKASLINEIAVMRKICHKNIMKLYEIYESEHSVYLIMDLINGGELLTRLRDCITFSQSDIAKLMFNLLEALKHLHEKGIMHRDLKPENILLRSKEEIHDIVIADFGLASFVKQNVGEVLFKRCGTPGYVAPEILVYKENQTEFYDEKCDIFSAGIIFFILLTGKKPFGGKDFKEILRLNKACTFDFTSLTFKNKPLSAIELLKKMVFFFPKARISAAMALKHKYFNEFLEKDAESPTLLVEEEGKMDSIPIFEIHPNNAKINFNVTPIQESYSNENSPYLLKHSPESINSPFFTRKPAFNGKIETIEKFEGNFNSSQNSPVESAGLKLTFDLSKDMFNYPGETKSNSNTPLHQDASQKRQIGQKKSSFNKQCSAAKSNLEKMEFDFKQN